MTGDFPPRFITGDDSALLGGWKFCMDREEELLPELQSAFEFVERLRAGEVMVVGDYGYIPLG